MLEFVRAAMAEEASTGPRTLQEMHAAHLRRRAWMARALVTAEEAAIAQAAEAKKAAEAAKKAAEAAKKAAEAAKRATEAKKAAEDAEAALSGPRSLRDIILLAAEEWGVAPLDVVSEGRRTTVSMARQAAMWLMRSCTTASQPRIGMALGGRDHTTVIHGLRMVEYRMAHDPELRARLVGLKARIDAMLGGTRAA